MSLAGPRLGRAAAAVALTFGLAACGPRELPAPLAGSADEAAPPRRGGTLELASFADIRSLDPASVGDGLATSMLEALYDGLVGLDATGHVVPRLARRWEVDPTGTRYRFFLRDDARFHDGERVTAADVKRSVERALHATTPNGFASFYASIVGFADLQAGRREDLPGVVVEGDDVVRFDLDRPDTTFLPALGQVALRPVCRSGGARWDDAFVPCGAGPFRLASWDRGRRLVLRRHDGYPGGGPPLDAVAWTFHMAITSQRERLLRGELSVVAELGQGDVLAFSRDPAWRGRLVFTDMPQIAGEAMNVEVPPFDRVEVRRAVAAALDRDALRLVKPTHLGAYARAVPPGLPGRADDVAPQRHDLTAALAHMASAGLPFDPATGRGGWPAPIPYLVYKQGLYEQTAQLVAQDLARIGLRLEIRVVSYPTWLTLIHRRGAVAMAPGGWSQDYPDALDFLEPLFHSSTVRDDDGNNQSFYRSPELDALLDAARVERDPAARVALVARAERRVLDDAPWAYTATYRQPVVTQGNVRGHRPHPTFLHDFREVWIAAPHRVARIFGRILRPPPRGRS